MVLESVHFALLCPKAAADYNKEPAALLEDCDKGKGRRMGARPLPGSHVRQRRDRQYGAVTALVKTLRHPLSTFGRGGSGNITVL